MAGLQHALLADMPDIGRLPWYHDDSDGAMESGPSREFLDEDLEQERKVPDWRKTYLQFLNEIHTCSYAFGVHKSPARRTRRPRGGRGERQNNPTSA